MSLSNDYNYALLIGKQSRAGAVGLLIYDQLLNLDAEKQLIWKQRWSFISVLYMFNRWCPLLWLVIDIIGVPTTHISPTRMCIVYLMVDNIVTLLTTLAVQGILQVRVWAIYQRSHKMLVLLCGMCFAEISAMAIMVGVTISRIWDLPAISTPTGCAYTGLIPVTALFWLPALIFEPILCALVVIKILYNAEVVPRKPGESFLVALSKATSLPIALARDGFVYFVGIFLELLAAMIIFAGFPHYINIVNPWTSALPAILGCRLLLNTRERLQRDIVTSTYHEPTFTSVSQFNAARFGSSTAYSEDTSTVHP